MGTIQSDTRGGKRDASRQKPKAMIRPAALSPAMVRTLRSAALGQLIAQPNHPSIRVLEKRGYVQRLEEVERRAGRYVVFSWGITENGREWLDALA